MAKVRILGIAPYKGLGELMEKTSLDREDIELHTSIGDLEAAIDLLQKERDINKYDAIISRGGTAEVIQKKVNIPVIDIKLTEYDMFRSIKLAQIYTGRIAIVGFPNIMRRANLICELMQFDIDTYVVRSEEDAEKTIIQLKSQGYSLIVGDVITVTKAKRYGLNGILITSGQESINEAFDEAVKISRLIKKMNNRVNLHLDILKNIPQQIIVLDRDKNAVFMNHVYSHHEFLEIRKKLPQYVDKVLEEKKYTNLVKANDELWKIDAVKIENSGREYYIFYIRKLFNSQEIEDYYSVGNINEKTGFSIINFYSSAAATQELIRDLDKIAFTNQSIIIYGEAGTGKDGIAFYIHSRSECRKNPFIIINFKNINEKSFHNLLFHENSPLMENEMTMYFKNIHCLNQDFQVKLVNYIDDSLLNIRNRIIYSTEEPISKNHSNPLFDYLIKNSTIHVSVPCLNDLKDEIPSLASICISELNQEFGKQVAGITDDAMELLKDFQWELNIYQFMNVLKKLILIADDMFIQKDETERVLMEELKLRSQKEVNKFTLTGTLDEITANIIQQVLEEESMNQSKAAKRLGISRSTLWRKLKEQVK